jgi:hypothetical protein
MYNNIFKHADAQKDKSWSKNAHKRGKYILSQHNFISQIKLSYTFRLITVTIFRMIIKI